MAIEVKKVYSVEGALSVAIYLAIGLAVYMWLGIDAGVAFSWASPWLYIYALLWPFVLFLEFLYWLIIAIVVVAVIAFIFILVDRR